MASSLSFFVAKLEPFHFPIPTAVEPQQAIAAAVSKEVAAAPTTNVDTAATTVAKDVTTTTTTTTIGDESTVPAVAALAFLSIVAAFAVMVAGQ